MLAQNFKSAADLGITEPQLSALQKTLVLLETGKLKHAQFPRFSHLENVEPKYEGNFNMLMWSARGGCGTIMCIGGTAEAVGDVSMGNWISHPGLYRLFRPNVATANWRDITPSQAATALRSFLTTGDARWDLAVA